MPLCKDSFQHVEGEYSEHIVKMECKEHRDVVSRTKFKDLVHTPNFYNSSQVGTMGEELRNVETPYVNNYDSSLEGTIDDDPN